jgi:hypothetical protein
MKMPRRFAFIALLGTTLPALAQFTQQGPKLVATGGPSQGESVSLSADGNTALVGGSNDSLGLGAAWVWTRSGGVWIQQGAKLAGLGAAGNSFQGTSVSLSADGNTAIVGGPGDNGGAGAAWVFARSGGVWTQQSTKLVGSGAVGAANQGISVSLCADGNTAIVGGFRDNNLAGAAWVWTRSGGVWTQQGTKLVGLDAAGNAQQGRSVSIAADGNTAIAGGTADNHVGAVWVWTRSGGAWTQQGPKLVGSVGRKGDSVSISGDGNTAIVGGPSSDGAWIFERNGGVWTQQGPKLVGSGASAGALQGYSVSLSADGNTAIVGAPFDHLVDLCCFGGYDFDGAAWVWKRSGGAWTQQGNKLVGLGSSGPTEQGHSVALSGDGNTAIIGGPTYSPGAAWVFVTGAELVPALSSFATVILLTSIALVALFRLK